MEFVGLKYFFLKVKKTISRTHKLNMQVQIIGEQVRYFF